MDLTAALNKLLKFLEKKGASPEVMEAFGEIRSFVTQVLGIGLSWKKF